MKINGEEFLMWIQMNGERKLKLKNLMRKKLVRNFQRGKKEWGNKGNEERRGPEENTSK